MPTLAYLGAAGAAVLGATIWGWIAWQTGYEVGYVAWGIGILVGGAGFAFGGRGQTCAVVCAALTVCSIFGGKYMAIKFSLDEFEGGLEQAYTEEMYQQMLSDAEMVSNLTPDEYPSFMVERGYTEASDPSEIHDEELEFFQSFTVPGLQQAANETTSFEEWREQQMERMSAFMADNVSMVDAVKESTGLMDIIFVLLGVSTAFQLGRGREEQTRHTGGGGGPSTGSTSPPGDRDLVSTGQS